MQVFDKDKIYNFMKFRYFTFALSAVLIAGAIALFFVKGFNY
ncbi:MAG: protein translocase subunit SecF, partial [Campylobacter sp.]|nr:protein translocase subunit SecF [Campylobacter sp.]